VGPRLRGDEGGFCTSDFQLWIFVFNFILPPIGSRPKMAASYIILKNATYSIIDMVFELIKNTLTYEK
jgi:hypothetical protein